MSAFLMVSCVFGRLLRSADKEGKTIPKMSDGSTMLMQAVRVYGDRVSAVKQLIECKVDVNATPTAPHHWTALSLATISGEEAVCKLLIEHKADYGVGTSPLGYLAARNNET